MTENDKRITANEYRAISREAILDYLRDKTTVAERKEVFKAALNEWLSERFAEFGWFSFKAIALCAFAVVMIMWLYLNGWHK